ncbi:MAG: PH domain-containing protein [Nocardioidaceae bacterium]
MPEQVELPRRYRPYGARCAAAIAAGALALSMAFLWVMLSQEVKATFSTFQRLTLLAFFATILFLLNAIFRTSAQADVDGLSVINGYKVRRFDWAEVLRVSVHSNRPWALLDVSDGSTVSVMAIQISDGDRARRAARELAIIIQQQSAVGDAD